MRSNGTVRLEENSNGRSDPTTSSGTVGHAPLHDSGGEQLFHLLARTHALINRKFNRQVSVELGITASQANALMQLREAGTLLIHELASCIGCDDSAISRLVDGLLVRGLVIRRCEREDGRARRLSLTPEGLAVASRVPVIRMQEELSQIEVLPVEERAFLRNLLRRALQACAPVNR